jgi:hypothetical protein
VLGVGRDESHKGRHRIKLQISDTAKAPHSR